jgi:hypothetical protein
MALGQVGFHVLWFSRHVALTVPLPIDLRLQLQHISKALALSVSHTLTVRWLASIKFFAFDDESQNKAGAVFINISGNNRPWRP